jgi:hypothetical protein
MPATRDGLEKGFQKNMRRFRNTCRSQTSVNMMPQPTCPLPRRYRWSIVFEKFIFLFSLATLNAKTVFQWTILTRLSGRIPSNTTPCPKYVCMLCVYVCERRVELCVCGCVLIATCFTSISKCTVSSSLTIAPVCVL